MKRQTYILVIILVFLFITIATLTSFIYLGVRGSSPVKSNSYLQINLSGDLQERSMPDFWASLFMGPQPLSLHDIRANIQKAKHDKRIKCLLLRMSYLECDWAKVDEIRNLVLDFRKSGKKAYAYFEESLEADKEYYLATACDQIVLHPYGWLIVNGIGGYIPFLKESLDKLGIELESEQVEEYKTANNMFTEKELTPAHRRMVESIYEDIFSLYIQSIAEARGKTEEEMRALIDHGFFQGKRALDAGLVDDLAFEEELVNTLKGEDKKINRVNLKTYAKTKAPSTGPYKGKKIALIYGMGPIHTGESFYQTMGSSSVARWIRAARKDKSIQAVVFRVDSPGGSAVASDSIWHEVALTKKEKPIIASMSDVAGSGGYMVSMAAHKIVAHPQTLTGSIGVIFSKFNMSKLYDKLGISGERMIFGKRADIFTTFRGLSPDERKLIKDEILWTYDQFITKVAESRSMKKEDVDNIGKGRVWTGRQAKELGLVDEIGGTTDAIKLAKEMAGIPSGERVRLVVWPKRVSFFEMLTSRKYMQAQPGLPLEIKKALMIFKLLENEKVWALMPFWISPN